MYEVMCHLSLHQQYHLVSQLMQSVLRSYNLGVIEIFASIIQQVLIHTYKLVMLATKKGRRYLDTHIVEHVQKAPIQGDEEFVDL